VFKKAKLQDFNASTFILRALQKTHKIHIYRLSWNSKSEVENKQKVEEKINKKIIDNKKEELIIT
jgi:hypothetical protein